MATVDSDVCTVELHTTLERVLGDHFGTPTRIAWLDRRRSEYASSFLLEELDVVLEDGQRLALMFKDVSRSGLIGDARDVKPDFLYNPLREITVYREMLACAELGTATCYGIVADERQGRFWIFLERVPGVEVWQRGEFEVWKQVARWLACAHRALARPTVSGNGHFRLLSYDAEFYRLWPRRALEFASAEARREIEWIVARYETAVECLLMLPVTRIHGEFFVSNVLVHDTPGGLRVCAVDWEMAAVAPRLIDLAAITEGWTDPERAELAFAYYEQLTPDERGAVASGQLLRALDVCRLHLCMQWLGWARQWTPTLLRHQQDWLGKALHLVESLEL